MVDFSVFRLRDEIADFDGFVELSGDRSVVSVGPIEGDGFAAKLFFSETWRRTPPWLAFVSQGFQDAIAWESSRAISALVVINADPEGGGRFFGLAFGPGGRHLLRNDAYFRRYGLIAALNLIAAGDDLPQLRAFDTVRHGQGILRSRLQTSFLSTIDVFELDVLRDLVRHATGQPADIERWGRRVGGSDAFRLAADITFAQIGEFCRRVDEVASSATYRDQFDWVDNIQPVNDKALSDALDQEVVGLLRDGRTDVMQLAPPEVVDWDLISGFRYHFDSRVQPPMSRSDVLLSAYLAGLRLSDPDLEDITPTRLRSRRVIALNEEGERYRDWSVWQCLVGEFEYQGESFVLEDGAFYRVAADYLGRLNQELLRFSQVADLLPPAQPGIKEPEYNRLAAESSDRFLLLDANLIHADGTKGGIELCDLLTDSKQFVHVKRYSSSKELSHLFAQARVAAELLLSNADFRTRARTLVGQQSNGDSRFEAIDAEAMRTGECEIVLAIIKRWDESDIDSLPFFAKVNLRRTIVDLTSWGYSVSVLRVPME